MLYSRHELIELVRIQPKELHSQLIALIWYASKGDPNFASQDRFGLLALNPIFLKAHGLEADQAALLDPKLNIALGAQLLERIGLVEFAGRNLAPQLASIISLAAWLDQESSAST